MKELTRIECADWLLERDHFVLLSHRKPDGDTLGSCAALCRGLRSLGKTAHILDNEDLTPLFAPLVEGLTKPQAEEGDILVVKGFGQHIVCRHIHSHQNIAFLGRGFGQSLRKGE